jgi:general secretion pathway protein D
MLDWDGLNEKNGARMKFRYCCGLLLIVVAVLLAGCSKTNQQYKAGTKAESLNDYDTALDNYNQALRSDPNNTEFKLKAARARFEASTWHLDQGRRLREQSNLELALGEFRKAQMIDPSSAVAAQEVQATTDLLAAKQGTTQNSEPASPAAGEPRLMAGPPQLEPISRAPINMKATNDAKAVFDAVGKLAGLTVIFDADYTSRRISVELTNVTLEQALNIVALQSKAFWRPVTSNIIFVAPDQAQKRKDYEEEIVKTFYLRNTVLPQELTEIVTSIRQLLDLRRVQQINAQNAIVIRDTPDRVLLAQKIIEDIDKAKPEVVIQVAVMQARRDRLQNMGIQPGTSASLAFAPPTTTTPTSGGTSTPPAASIALNQLQRLSTADYSLTLPGAQANFLMTDSSTHIIDNPEIRVVDGQTAKLKVGDRVPVATGSFQAGVGVGGGGAGGLVNPLVNTQFQYLDVGVNVDVTPRIHPDHEISLKINVVVSSVTGQQPIGGINQPIISQRSIEHDVRLKDGEVSVLGGLIERTDSNTINGWPGLAKLPFFRYFFSSDNIDHQENEVLIVLIPHIVRLPTMTAENLRSIASGTDANAEVRLENVVMAPQMPKTQGVPVTEQPPAGTSQPPAAPAAPSQTAATQSPSLRFDPGAAALKPGETTTIGVVVQNVQDLYSIPMLLQYNPAVISVEDVRQGGFLSGGTQDIAIVERVDKERGQAIISATRMPNTPGVSGSGTLVGIVVRGVAPGNSQLSIVQVNGKDSQQRPIQMVTSEAAIRVQ